MDQQSVSLTVALLGGILSFVSPCVLPLVPAYLGFLTGSSLEEIKNRGKAEKIPTPLWPALAFVLGFSTVFIALGAGASSLSRFLLIHQEIFARVSGIIIVILGLHFLGLFRLQFLYREARLQPEVRPKTLIGAYIIGLAFAFGWTPCIGPVLATILTIAAAQEHLSDGILLLAVYSAGLGIPFLAAALGINAFLAFMQKFRKHMRAVEMAMGLLLVATGIAIFTSSLQGLGNILLEWFPALQNIG
jgi:cytochrome c-type biogenesis protein